MPTSTDLVTDLPADFEVFGQAVDTSLADLKGGTSGQILSKASATDMDFTWITNDVGDITAVTAGTGITGGGTSGAVTVSFDQANFGGGQFAAGKNALLNADMAINQRQFTSGTSTGAFVFDRWQQNNLDGTCTFSAQTFTTGAAPVAGYEAINYARAVTTGQTAANALAIFTQKLEDVRSFAGQTVTVSFWAQAGTGTPSIAIELDQQFGSGGSTRVATFVTKTAITTSWARYSATVTLPSISGKTIGTNSFLTLGMWVSAGTDFNARTSSLGIQSNTFNIWGVQLEAGSTATPFQTATGTKQGELAACQRYYWRSPFESTYAVIGTGSAYSTANARIFIPLLTQMRTQPSTLDYGGTTPFSLYDGTTVVGGFAGTTLTLENGFLSSSKGAVVTMATGGTSLTAFRPYFLVLNSAGNSSQYIGFGAEL